MQRAMQETNRRRLIQMKYNQDNGIIPKTIVKAVPDIMEGARVVQGHKKKAKPKVVLKSPILDEILEAKQNIHGLTEKELAKKMVRWEEGMYTHAQNLEFEIAAKIRDELKLLEALAFKPGTMLS